MSLKKFEIQEMIAKGGMAEVYRAKTVGLQGFEKEVCVKKILPHLTEDESFVNMFINEAKLAATLSYANIVSVHDLCVSAGGEYFIVMEYVHGKDLSDVIRAAQLAGREVPPDIAVYVGREICRGLHYAHSKTDPTGAKLNIIHRDISPHNVLVSFMGEVKLTDFGIAKASSIMNKTAVGILKGKYGYMSPEQARGQPLDHRSDIFNTGIVLYELLVGERCFAGSSDFSTLNLMRNATVTPPTKINAKLSKDLETIVLKALSADRNDRYADAMELEAALARFGDSRGRRFTAADLGQFMRELFSSTDADRPANSTGVLSLASVVGPAAKPGVRVATQRHAELADQPISGKVEAPPPPDEPGKEALERAKKRFEKGKEKEKEKDKANEPHALSPEERRAKTAQVERVKAPPEERGDTKPKESKEAKEAPKEAVPPAKEEAPKERKPARIKPVAAEAEAKAEPKEKKEKKEEKKEKKGKQLSDTPKKPVGRRDLRPGLTQIQALSRPEKRRSLARASAIVIGAGVLGAAIGWIHKGGATKQSSFREMELASRDNTSPRKPTVTVLLSSEPQGATVMFDKIELSEKTPLAVERDRDDSEHTIELALDGYKPTQRSMRYQTGPVTRFAAKLSGEDGTLKINSKPSDLPVRVEGKVVGNTPLTMSLPSGRRQIEIGDDTCEVVKTTVDVIPKKTVTITRSVAKKGSLASLRITSEPEAQIFLDDQPTGRHTNDGFLMLEPGVQHRVGLQVRDTESKHEIMVKLKKGEKKDLFLDLTGST